MGISNTIGGWWFQAFWKIWVRQLGWWNSQLNGKSLKKQTDHQAAICFIAGKIIELGHFRIFSLCQITEGIRWASVSHSMSRLRGIIHGRRWHRHWILISWGTGCIHHMIAPSPKRLGSRSFFDKTKDMLRLTMLHGTEEQRCSSRNLISVQRLITECLLSRHLAVRHGTSRMRRQVTILYGKIGKNTSQAWKRLHWWSDVRSGKTVDSCGDCATHVYTLFN